MLKSPKLKGELIASLLPLRMNTWEKFPKEVPILDEEIGEGFLVQHLVRSPDCGSYLSYR